MIIEKRMLGSNDKFLALAENKFKTYKEDSRIYLYEDNTEYVFYKYALIKQGLIKEIGSLNDIVGYEVIYTKGVKKWN